MTGYFVFLCVVIMFFGIVGCPGYYDAIPVASQSFKSTPIATVPGDTGTSTAPEGAPIPEPYILMLLGSGLVGLVALGRNKFKK